VLTFLCRNMPELMIEAGYVSAQPPLFQVTHQRKDLRVQRAGSSGRPFEDASRTRASRALQGRSGEMNPIQLWEGDR